MTLKGLLRSYPGRRSLTLTDSYDDSVVFIDRGEDFSGETVVFVVNPKVQAPGIILRRKDVKRLRKHLKRLLRESAEQR